MLKANEGKRTADGTVCTLITISLHCMLYPGEGEGLILSFIPRVNCLIENVGASAFTTFR